MKKYSSSFLLFICCFLFSFNYAHALPQFNASADVVIGQADFTHNSANQGGSVGGNTLYGPWDVFVYGHNILIPEYWNHRVLIFNSIPTSNNASANVVIGQQDLTHNSANQAGSPGANTLYKPRDVYFDGTKLFVADANNNRVLIYDAFPVSNNASASVVVGQTNFANNSANQGGSPAANTLKAPWGVYSDGTRLFVADNGNHRVLVYNSIPTSNNASANVVIGQTNLSGGSINQGGSVGANTLNSPSDIFVVNGKILISDANNNRVLIYNAIPTSNNASADVVIGQVNFSGGSANQGGSVAANTLMFPEKGLFSDGTRLFIGDTWNDRALIYNSIPTGNNASADVVVGQPNFTSRELNQGNGETNPGPNGFYGVRGVYSDGSRLFAGDGDNNRVLIYTLSTSSESLTAPGEADSREVALSLSATDGKDMMISENSDFSGASWETYATTKTFTLSEGDGTKTIYAKFRDFANYEGNTISRQINLDQSLPIIAIGNNKVFHLSANETLSTRFPHLVFREQVENLPNGKVELYQDGTLLKTKPIDQNSRFRIKLKSKERNKAHIYQFKYYNSQNELAQTSAEYRILFDKVKPKFTKGNPKTRKAQPGDTITWSVADNDQIKYYQYTFQGKTYKTNQNQFTLPPDLKRGKTWKFKVRAYDRAENRETRKMRVRVR